MTADQPPACGRCGATAGTRQYPCGRRCPACTPAALAGRAEPRPDPDTGLAALRARRAIAAEAFVTPSSTVVDERAVASGKRRSSHHVHQAVKAAEAARRRSRRGAG